MQLLYRHTNNYFTYCKLNRFLRAQPSAAQKTEVGEKNAQKHTNEKNRNTPAIQFTAMPLMNNPKLLHLLRDTYALDLWRGISLVMRRNALSIAVIMIVSFTCLRCTKMSISVTHTVNFTQYSYKVKMSNTK